MKGYKLFFIIVFTTNLFYAQSNVIEKVSTQICDSLKNPENRSYLDSKELIKSIIIDNYKQWSKELISYKENTGQEGYLFNEYFKHYTEVNCPEFRILNESLDTYLNSKKHLKPLYLKTKEFIYALEDETPIISILFFLNKDLKTRKIKTLLETASKEINLIKQTTTLSIINVYVDGYTFTVRYFDYLTNVPQFQIDINFSDHSNLSIDKLSIKKNSQLIKELKNRIEFNKKNESGEIKIPAPPAFPPPLKKKKGN